MHLPVFPVSWVPYTYFHNTSPHSLRFSCWADMMHQILFENNSVELIISLFLFFVCEGEFSNRDWRMKPVSGNLVKKRDHFQNFCISHCFKNFSWHRLGKDVIFQNGYCLDIAKTLTIWNEIVDLQFRTYNWSKLQNFLQLLFARKGHYPETEYICRKVVTLNLF